MSEGTEESSTGLVAPPSSASPANSGVGPEEEPSAAGAGEEGEGSAPPGPVGLPVTCCVCLEGEQVRGCLRSEKICILPILACLLSLALCTAGLKWVFVDKIFEYEPSTHLDLKRIGSDPLIVADPTESLPKSSPQSYSSVSTSTTGQTEVPLRNTPTTGPFSPSLPRVTVYNPTLALTVHTKSPGVSGPPSTIRPTRTETVTPCSQPNVESNAIHIPKFSVTSTTPPVRTSSHEKYCPESQKNYCVNGGTCFTIQVTPGTNKLLCRCLPGFSGNRCQDIVPMKVMNQKQAEELYQKRVLTITGICIALLVVGIMCVVAYCKTKKQRKKLQDRLRQSVRNERSAMPGMANGPQMHSQAPESIQLANQYASKNPIPAEHTIEKETSFSASQYTSSAQNSTAVTHSCSQSWSNGRGEGVLSDSRSGPVASSMENSRNITPGSRRGRLNATGCARDLNVAYLNNPRETPDSYKDSPYSERYVSAMTTPTRISPVELPCPASPKSPPSEMSAPLSSLAMSVPSVAVSPQGEEECPLLFTTPPRLRDKQRQDHAYSNGNQYQRSSAHYNHGLEANSTPPSPQRTAEDDDYETTPEYETTVPQASKKVTGSRRASRAKVNGHVAHKPESKSDSSSESSSSESETEDERVGEDTPFLSIQNPLAVSLESATSCRPSDSSRTNPALRLSAQEDLQARLSSVIVNQDPIAV
ncbi:pro-neuregulin-1, membrane-bound isoform isoform X9 [Paramormyrops kingsleyae]|uniref:pro-neuregulin-1, membrane-bound isoform isoform X9 n=1 Tax=Paramormyrops kingsleyae TaxID=1676925 RepID=UPI000CD5DD6D|nr:pro-neuregulin-1, membrane-bound isoform isoform X5 [Paramormyrops kingsleyae]